MALLNLVHVLKRAFLLLLFAHTLWATTMVIATNPHSPIDKITPTTVKKLYLDQQQLIANIRPLKLTLTYQNPLRKCFEKKVLHMNKEELQLYWLETRYLGYKPPKVLASFEAVALYLKEVPNAIGYIPLSVARKYRLKILLRWECDDENTQ